MPRKRGKTWHYDFTIKGVRYRGPLPKARTKREAIEQEDRLRISVHDGTYGQPSARTLGEFIEEVFKPWAYVHYRTSPAVWLSTIKVISNGLGSLSLSEIAPITIERWKRERLQQPTRRDKPRKGESVNREMTYLSRILSLAVEQGLLRENPCSQVKWFPEGGRRTRYMTEAEEVKILAYLDLHHPLAASYTRLALHTGMRRGEIAALTWRDVDTDRGLIIIRMSKSGKGRTIPINEIAAQVLSFQRRMHTDSEKVFPGSKEWVTVAFRNAARKCGIDDLRFHDLRHTAATRMGAAGVDAFTLADILGHTDLRQTRQYTHALEASKRRAVEALARAPVTNLSQWKREEAK